MSKILIVFALTLFLGIQCQDDTADESACQGRAFPALCSVMLVMKRDIDASNGMMLQRFGEVLGMLQGLKDQKVATETIDSEVRALTKIQATGIRMVTKEMEKRIEALSRALKFQIRESMHELDLRTDDVVKFTHRDVLKLRDEVVHQFKANGAVYKKSLKKVEVIVEDNKNETNNLVHAHTVRLEAEIDRRVYDAKNSYFKGYTSVNRQLGNKIKSTKKTLFELQQKFSFLNSSDWSPDSYCILANGQCPDGFKYNTGEMSGMSMFSPNVTYLLPADFGSSKIGCSGNCAGPEPWNGDLILSTCCK